MSTKTFCDYPDCERIAVTRITEERLDGLSGLQVLGDPPTQYAMERSLDACQEHRTVTHPGWWCYDHEEVLRQQALRQERAAT